MVPCVFKHDLRSISFLYLLLYLNILFVVADNADIYFHVLVEKQFSLSSTVHGNIRNPNIFEVPFPGKKSRSSFFFFLPSAL